MEGTLLRRITAKSHCDYLDPDGDVIGECSVGKIANWGGFYIAVIHDDVPEGEREATANVIAAAPELLEACKLALNAFERNDAIDWNILEQAINKADGKP